MDRVKIDRGRGRMAVDNNYILAIDLGTSGPKVALVSIQGEMIASEFE